MMFWTSFPVGPLACNCSIIGCPETGVAAVIDPGGHVDTIVEILQKQGLKAKYILHTHAHFDHILGARELKDRTGASICLHEGDQWLYDALPQQARLLGIPLSLGASEPHPIDHYLQDEQELQIGQISSKVLHTPGHTPGSLCFSVEDQESIVFAGDTLFQHSIGRTDFPGGSFDDIIKSIRQRLFQLDDSTAVIPGHGPNTTIWAEKKENPFVGVG